MSTKSMFPQAKKIAISNEQIRALIAYCLFVNAGLPFLAIGEVLDFVATNSKLARCTRARVQLELNNLAVQGFVAKSASTAPSTGRLTYKYGPCLKTGYLLALYDAWLPKLVGDASDTLTVDVRFAVSQAFDLVRAQNKIVVGGDK